MSHFRHKRRRVANQYRMDQNGAVQDTIYRGSRPVIQRNPKRNVEHSFRRPFSKRHKPVIQIRIRETIKDRITPDIRNVDRTERPKDRLARPFILPGVYKRTVRRSIELDPQNIVPDQGNRKGLMWVMLMRDQGFVTQWQNNAKTKSRAEAYEQTLKLPKYRYRNVTTKLVEVNADAIKTFYPDDVPRVLDKLVKQTVTGIYKDTTKTLLMRYFEANIDTGNRSNDFFTPSEISSFKSAVKSLYDGDSVSREAFSVGRERFVDGPTVLNSPRTWNYYMYLVADDKLDLNTWIRDYEDDLAKPSMWLDLETGDVIDQTEKDRRGGVAANPAAAAAAARALAAAAAAAAGVDKATIYAQMKAQGDIIVAAATAAATATGNIAGAVNEAAARGLVTQVNTEKTKADMAKAALDATTTLGRNAGFTFTGATELTEIATWDTALTAVRAEPAKAQAAFTGKFPGAPAYDDNAAWTAIQDQVTRTAVAFRLLTDSLTKGQAATTKPKLDGFKRTGAIQKGIINALRTALDTALAKALTNGFNWRATRSAEVNAIEGQITAANTENTNLQGLPDPAPAPVPAAYDDDAAFRQVEVAYNTGIVGTAETEATKASTDATSAATTADWQTAQALADQAQIKVNPFKTTLATALATAQPTGNDWSDASHKHHVKYKDMDSAVKRVQKAIDDTKAVLNPGPGGGPGPGAAVYDDDAAFQTVETAFGDVATAKGEAEKALTDATDANANNDATAYQTAQNLATQAEGKLDTFDTQIAAALAKAKTENQDWSNAGNARNARYQEMQTAVTDARAVVANARAVTGAVAAPAFDEDALWQNLEDAYKNDKPDGTASFKKLSKDARDSVEAHQNDPTNADKYQKAVDDVNAVKPELASDNASSFKKLFKDSTKEALDNGVDWDNGDNGRNDNNNPVRWDDMEESIDKAQTAVNTTLTDPGPAAGPAAGPVEKVDYPADFDTYIKKRSGTVRNDVFNLMRRIFNYENKFNVEPTYTKAKAESAMEAIVNAKKDENYPAHQRDLEQKIAGLPALTLPKQYHPGQTQILDNLKADLERIIKYDTASMNTTINPPPALPLPDAMTPTFWNQIQRYGKQIEQKIEEIEELHRTVLKHPQDFWAQAENQDLATQSASFAAEFMQDLERVVESLKVLSKPPSSPILGDMLGIPTEQRNIVNKWIQNAENTKKLETEIYERLPATVQPQLPGDSDVESGSAVDEGEMDGTLEVFNELYQFVTQSYQNTAEWVRDIHIPPGQGLDEIDEGVDQVISGIKTAINQHLGSAPAQQKTAFYHSIKPSITKLDEAMIRYQYNPIIERVFSRRTNASEAYKNSIEVEINKHRRLRAGTKNKYETIKLRYDAKGTILPAEKQKLIDFQKQVVKIEDQYKKNAKMPSQLTASWKHWHDERAVFREALADIHKREDELVKGHDDDRQKLETWMDKWQGQQKEKKRIQSPTKQTPTRRPIPAFDQLDEDAVVTAELFGDLPSSEVNTPDQSPQK